MDGFCLVAGICVGEAGRIESIIPRFTSCVCWTESEVLISKCADNYIQDPVAALSLYINSYRDIDTSFMDMNRNETHR